MLDTIFSPGDLVIFNSECNLNILHDKFWIYNNPDSFDFFNAAKDGAVFKILSISKAYNDCYLLKLDDNQHHRAGLWMIKKLNPDLKEFI